MLNARRIAIPFAVVTVGTVAVAVSLWLYQSVKDHGWEGTFRYIWEGEYYPEDIRSALELLEAAETQLAVHIALVELMETSLARAKLNSVDDHSHVKKGDWAIAHRPGNLEKDLATLSFDLDKLAAAVDAVVLEDIDLRPKKKMISREIVKVMAQADELLKIYQQKDSVSQ
jgi:hypothetical protein